jgi:probable inorganic polyphosphate/ATP-NAD kinase
MVRHRNRTNAVTSAVTLTHALAERGIEVVEDASSGGVDLVLSIGGDGTFLVAASSARALGVPLLGVNAGHMGFLTELGSTGTGDLARKIAEGDFTVERRMTLDVTMERSDGSRASDWALNEAVIMHTDVAHPVHFALVVDGQEVSTYGADGMILSTPTGSTAYSFSAGGPVVWPDTEAIVVAPLAAHGLFTRPLVVGPSACVEIVVLDDMWTAPEMWCDGLRRMTVPAGAVVRARVGFSPVQLVRVDDTPFSARLVRKFNLPVRGWRDGPR